MNTKFATEVARVIRDKWIAFPQDQFRREIDSGEVYNELVSRNVEVPEGDMAEILETFERAQLIGGPGYMNSEAHKRDGAMVITSVNIQLIEQLEFD